MAQQLVYAQQDRLECLSLEFEDSLLLLLATRKVALLLNLTKLLLRGIHIVYRVGKWRKGFSVLCVDR